MVQLRLLGGRVRGLRGEMLMRRKELRQGVRRMDVKRLLIEAAKRKKRVAKGYGKR